MIQGDLRGKVMAGEKIKVAVLGASGYTGAEVIRLCANHSHINITTLTAERAAGKLFEEVFPSLAPAAVGMMVKIGDVDFDAVDAVFCCLPHATTHQVCAPQRCRSAEKGRKRSKSID
jgi:N-acetyl-gamma-glutamyl-phosphate reductase